MRYINFYLLRSIQFALPIAGACLLANRLGVGITLALFAAVASVGVALSGWLLHHSELEVVNWKNRVAGLLTPWGWRFASGKLIPALIGSWVVWMLLAVCGALIANRNVDFGSSDHAARLNGAITLLLVIAWIVDGGALLYIVSNTSKSLSLGSSHGRSLLKIVSVIAILLIASVVLFLTGHPLLALLVAGGPPLVLGILYAAFFGILLAFGKKVRWN